LRPQDVIRKKRDGEKLSREEINFFIDGCKKKCASFTFICEISMNHPIAKHAKHGVSIIVAVRELTGFDKKINDRLFTLHSSNQRIVDFLN